MYALPVRPFLQNYAKQEYKNNQAVDLDFALSRSLSYALPVKPFLQNYAKKKTHQVVDPDFALSLSYALPVKPFLQNYVSAWIIGLRQNGIMEQFINRYARNRYCDVCGMCVCVCVCARAREREREREREKREYQPVRTQSILREYQQI